MKRLFHDLQTYLALGFELLQEHQTEDRCEQARNCESAKCGVMDTLRNCAVHPTREGVNGGH